MINIQLKPQKENTYCPLCFSIVTKANIDKHLDEKHPRNGYIAKKNVPLTIIQHVLDFLCPDCYLTYEDLEKLKEHFNLVHHFSIREEEIPEEKPVVKTPEPPKKPTREPRVFVVSELPKQPIKSQLMILLSMFMILLLLQDVMGEHIIQQKMLLWKQLLQMGFQYDSMLFTVPSAVSITQI